MDRYECRDREEDLDRAAWRAAWSRARRGAKRALALPPGAVLEAAVACLAARQAADFRGSGLVIVASDLKTTAGGLIAAATLETNPAAGAKHKMLWQTPPFQAVHGCGTTVPGQSGTVGRSGETVAARGI